MELKKKNSPYYSLDQIDKCNAPYNVVYGERSNGKTYACLLRGLENYINKGEQMAIIRRWRDDLVGARGQQMFQALTSNDEINKISNGKWQGVRYFASKWYLYTTDEDGNIIKDETPFCFGFALTSMEHDKSTAYPKVTSIIFDEFISRKGYLPDEFVLFMNVISTIIRHRNNVKIYMLGNAVDMFCPYFTEMGLKHLDRLKPGDIDVYKYGNTKLKVAVEHTEPTVLSKTNNFYFAFDNPKLKMITEGAWEIDIYPHLPCKYAPKDILFTYFIIFQDETVQCEIISVNDSIFTYIHRKSTPIAHPDTDLVYSCEEDMRPNWKTRITSPTSIIERKIVSFFVQNKVFYQDNNVGELVRAYIMWSSKKTFNK